MWTAIAAVTALLSAIVAVGGALWVFVDAERVRRRLEIQDEKLQSLQSKQAADSRWGRDEIRDRVDSYLETLDIGTSGGADSELMEAMLPALMSGMMGGGGQGNQQSAEQVEQQPQRDPRILGQGGQTNGEPSETR